VQIPGAPGDQWLGSDLAPTDQRDLFALHRYPDHAGQVLQQPGRGIELLGGETREGDVAIGGKRRL